MGTGLNGTATAAVFAYHDVGARCLRVLLERGVEVRLVATHRDDPGENVFFESGSANLLPESEDELSQLGTALERFPDVKLEIQGHTDTRGAASGNMRLSQARADAVRTWLLSHYHGIHDANLTAKGYGETQPETKERNEEELLRNRRVELRLLNPEVLPKGVKVEH